MCRSSSSDDEVIEVDLEETDENDATEAANPTPELFQYERLCADGSSGSQGGLRPVRAAARRVEQRIADGHASLLEARPSDDEQSDSSDGSSDDSERSDGTAVEGATTPIGEQALAATAPLSEYEQQRLRNIEANKAVLANLGLLGTASPPKRLPASAKPKRSRANGSASAAARPAVQTRRTRVSAAIGRQRASDPAYSEADSQPAELSDSLSDSASDAESSSRSRKRVARPASSLSSGGRAAGRASATQGASSGDESDGRWADTARGSAETKHAGRARKQRAGMTEEQQEAQRREAEVLFQMLLGVAGRPRPGSLAGALLTPDLLRRALESAQMSVDEEMQLAMLTSFDAGSKGALNFTDFERIFTMIGGSSSLK